MLCLFDMVLYPMSLELLITLLENNTAARCNLYVSNMTETPNAGNALWKVCTSPPHMFQLQCWCILIFLCRILGTHPNPNLIVFFSVGAQKF